MPGFNIGNSTGSSSPDNKGEFHRQHRWRISSLGVPLGGGSSGATRTRGQQHHLWAHTLQLPELSFEEEKILAASLTYKIAKSAKWKNITVKFYDTLGLYKKLREWQDKIWTPEEGIKKAVDYKGEPVFLLTDGKGEVQQEYILKGAYPINIAHGDLSYTNSEIKLLSVTYSYDHAIIKLHD